MPPATTTDLLTSLRSLHILDAPQLEKLKELQGKLPDPQGLIKKLIKHGWVTTYQAQMLFHNRGNELLLGSYVLLERLGEGGMGEVYKARNWKMNRIVALKVIRKDRLKSELAVKRFHREVQAVAHLNHPNIVMAYDAGNSSGTHYFAMEYVEGVELAALVKQGGPLPIPLACSCIQQAAKGLQHATERGLVHRDIKPSNLLITPPPPPLGKGGLQSTVKLLDMGLARKEDVDEETSALTQEGSVLGTVDYLSPEQALNAHTADVRSDLYSLGCTFYYLLTGRVPYSGGTATEKLLKHRIQEPEPIQKLRPEVPSGVVDVVRKLMEKKPEDRYQTPQQLVDVLASSPAIRAADQRFSPKPMGKPQDAMAPTIEERFKGATFVAKTIGGAKKAWGMRKWIAAGAGALVMLILIVALFPRGSSSAPSTEGSSSTKPKAPKYVKRATRQETITATLQASGYPALTGRWYRIGLFESFLGDGFGKAYDPEREIILTKSYPGKARSRAAWESYDFQTGRITNLDIYPQRGQFSVIYLYHEIKVARPVVMPIKVGADDSIKIWLNNKNVLEESQVVGLVDRRDPYRWEANLELKPGKNRLLVKVCNNLGRFEVILSPQWPEKLEDLFGSKLQKDFPQGDRFID